MVDGDEACIAEGGGLAGLAAVDQRNGVACALKGAGGGGSHHARADDDDGVGAVHWLTVARLPR